MGFGYCFQAPQTTLLSEEGLGETAGVEEIATINHTQLVKSHRELGVCIISSVGQQCMLTQV